MDRKKNRRFLLPAALASLLLGVSRASAWDSVATGITHYYDFETTVKGANKTFTIKGQKWDTETLSLVTDEAITLTASGTGLGTSTADKTEFDHSFSGGGTSAYIANGSAGFLHPAGNQWTISFWAMRENATFQTRLLVNGTPLTGYKKTDLEAVSADGNTGFGFYMIDGSQNQGKVGVRLAERTITGATTNYTVKSILSSGTFTWTAVQENWRNILLVRDGATLTLYVGGVEQGSTTMEETSEIEVPGNGLWTTIKDAQWKGNALDEIAIWNRALGADEIAAIAAGDKPLSRMALPLEIVWQAEGGSGLWSAGGSWDIGCWLDNVPTVFPTNAAEGTVGVDTNATAASIAFNGSYTLTNANGTLTVPGPVTVAADKTVTIRAPISGALAKSGPGMIVIDHGLTNASSYSFSGPATVQNGQLSAPVTLASDAALTLKGVTLQKALAGNGARLTLAGTNTLGAGIAIGGFSETVFGAGSQTCIAGTGVTLGALGTVTAGAGSGLAVKDGAGLTYDHAVGMSLPAFTELAGAVTISGVLTTEQIQNGTPIDVAKVPADLDAAANFSGAVKTGTGAGINVVFTNDSGTVKMRANITAKNLVYTKKTDENAFTWENGANFDNDVFGDFDNVSFVEDGDAGHTVTVNVGSNVVAGGVTIGSGFVFAGEPFIASTLTKTNAGASSIGNIVAAGGVAAAGGALDAAWLAAGTVAVSNGAALRAGTVDRRVMRFLRLTVTRGSGDKSAISELRLFRKTPYGHEKFEWPANTKLWDNMGETNTYTSGSGTAKVEYGGETKGDVPIRLIDGHYKGSPTDDGNRGEYELNKWWPGWDGNGHSWVIIAFPAAAPVPDGYNFFTADTHKARIPKDWTVEFSADGRAWATLSVVADAPSPDPLKWFTANNGGADAPAFLFDTPAADVSAVTAAADGTVVADGDWTARLTLEAGATLKAETNSCLMLHTTNSASAQIDAGLTVDLSAYASTVAGKRYILAGDAKSWTASDGFTVTEKAADQTLGKNNGGYYVEIAPRTLAWGPADGDTARLWLAGFGQTPWKADNAQTFFRDNDSVTFGPAGGGGEVKVSGTVRPASAAFEAGAAYLLRPADDAEAELVLPSDDKLTVSGILTNRVAAIRPGLTIADGGRLVQEAAGKCPGKTDIAAGAELVLAPAADAEQWISGNIKGEGNIVKDGDGTTTITGQINSTGTLAVAAGKLVIDGVNQKITATKDSPVFVGRDATIRFQTTSGRRTRMPNDGWLLCDGGTVEINASNPFDQDQNNSGVNLPNFVLTNGATFLSENGHIKVKTVSLNGSEIRISRTVDYYNNEGLVVYYGMTAAGDSSIVYTPGGEKPNALLIENDKDLEIAEGGTLSVAVRMRPRLEDKKEIPLRKTGPGALAAAKGSVFTMPVQIEAGVLKLPQEAGTFEKTVTFTNGVAIDVSGRTNAFAWGANLTVGDGVTVKVDVTGRGIRPGEPILTWDAGAEPAGDFTLVGAGNLVADKTGTMLTAKSGGMVFILR